MERELLVTGIGGQGVQLAAEVLARGATLEGSYVMLFGVYAGAMRGMNTDATVVIGDEPLHSPPLISHTWSAIGMHDKFWEPIGRKLRDGALVLVNDATFETELDESRYRVLRVPATDVADELGNPLGGSMVMAGAYAAISGLVGLDALLEGMRESIPPYRTQHIAANETAIRAGHEWGAAAGMSVTKSKGTVTIAIEACKGCDLCIPVCPPAVLTMSTAVNHLGYHYPELADGCTGCAACLLICPDFVFEVFREVRGPAGARP